MRFTLSLLAFIVLGVAAASPALAGDVRVIVNFKGHGHASAAVVEQAGGRVHRTLHNAVAADLSPAAIAQLRADPRVASVEEDGIAGICAKPEGKGKPAPSQPANVVPWGIEHVGAPLSGNTGVGIKVAVIDTGIDLKHPDLKANIAGSKTFVGKTAKDDNGHGTHVAGTIGALDNDIGVIGVAPGVSLYAVKVLDRRGWGYWSDIAAGIDWARVNGMHVANMSLGGNSDSLVRIACANAEIAGVLLVAAAGNSGDGKIGTSEISYPAAYPTVVAVGATNINSGLAYFSNSFPLNWSPLASPEEHLVEVSAPGVSVKSTWKGGGYNTISGTSMASPHAAGVAALIWKSLGVGSSVTDVRNELDTTTLDLGHEEWDTGYGSGLVQVPGS